MLAWNALNFHILVLVELSSVTKKGEIESPSLVLVITLSGQICVMCIDGQWAGPAWAGMVTGQHSPMGSGRQGTPCPVRHAYQARGLGLRPRHGTMGLFPCHASQSSTTKLAGHASP